ncbi:MAG: succinyl-diaminopimelate desuccinylase [Nitriliruptorales bacterium]|nr:succinyl-diaminopimelate desuccinylase [Nitriliruptorales bacterium]
MDLVERLLDHCSHVCVTGEEAPIADAVAARAVELGLPLTRVGDSVIIGERTDDGRPLVLLVGHLDVVPPTEDDLHPRVESRPDGDVVVARGASDMKAGNVIALDVIEDLEFRQASPYELAVVLYAREEGPAAENELADVLDQATWLREAELAIVLEPTDSEIQLGCLGALHATVEFTGKQAHSARPWHGENALTKAAPFLAEVGAREAVDVEVDGVVFRDVWSATQAWTENARNVIPGSFTVNLNLRFAPTRGLEEAEQELRDMVGDRAIVDVIDRAPPAPPRRDAELVEAFIASVDAPVTAKQAWTDVARFAAVDVPALNFGPGLTSQAHQRGEYIPVAALHDAASKVRGFLRG